MKATGLTHGVYSQFDEPELLDDLKDHWQVGGQIRSDQVYCMRSDLVDKV